MPETFNEFQYRCLKNQDNPPAPVEKDPVEDYTRAHCRLFGVPASVISNGLRAEKSWHKIIEDYQEKNIWKPVKYLKDKWVGILPVWSPEAIEKFPNLFAPYLFPGPNKREQVLTSWLIVNHGERLLKKLMEDEEDSEEEEDSESEGEGEDMEEEEKEFCSECSESKFQCEDCENCLECVYEDSESEGEDMEAEEKLKEEEE